MLNDKLINQIKELIKRNGGNEKDLLIVFEMVEQTPVKRRTISDIEEDLINGEMIDLPKCDERDIKIGCYGCRFLSNDGTCKKKTEHLENLIQEMVDYMVKEGTEQTTSGLYMFSHEDLMEKFNITKEFIIENEDYILNELYLRDEILDVEWEDCFDLNFFLRYCPNVDE